MDKKILLLTAGKTGGHRSASNAIKAAFLEIDPTLNINDYDSNKLFLGYKEGSGEQGYINLTTRFRLVWKIFFEFSSFFRKISNYFLYQAIKHHTFKLLDEYKPDLIVSLHPCFVGSIIKVLKKTKRRIPFYVVVLDPVKHSSLWRDKRSDLNFLPVKETKDIFIKDGFKEETLIQCGFPLSKKNIEVKKEKNDRKKLIFVNPSQRSLKTTLKLIEVAYSFDVNIDIITGSDGKLKKYLEKNLTKRDGVNIFGYVNDMDYRLRQGDIILTKAGPNIMFEAISASIPIIFTGHLLGQEELNYIYATSRGYAFVAEKPKELFLILKKILIDEPSLLLKMSEKEKLCPDLDGAKNIATTIINNLKNL